MNANLSCHILEDEMRWWSWIKRVWGHMGRWPGFGWVGWRGEMASRNQVAEAEKRNIVRLMLIFRNSANFWHFKVDSRCLMLMRFYCNFMLFTVILGINTWFVGYLEAKIRMVLLFTLFPFLSVRGREFAEGALREAYVVSRVRVGDTSQFVPSFDQICT